MKVRIVSRNVTVDVPNGHTTYQGCLPVWDNFSQKVIITDLPASNIQYMRVTLQPVLPYAYDMYLEPVNGMELDLSTIAHPLMEKYQNKISTYYVNIYVSHVPGSSSETQHLIIPVMNLASPNTLGRIGKADTDFKDELGHREGLMHTLDDVFYIDSRQWNETYNVEALYQDGSPDTFRYSQGETIGDACQYKKITIKRTDGSVVAVKFYPPEINLCGAITLKWLNSCGSFDAISCQNWFTQPAIQQGLDGGVITKQELTCVFELTEANKFALDWLSRSADTQIIGLPGLSGWINARCSSTTGVKMTASGLATTVTLKFQY